MQRFLSGVVLVIAIEIVACGIFVLVLISGGFQMGADVQPGTLETWIGRGSRSLWVSANAPKVKSPIPVTSQTLERGAKLYQDNCAVCHGGAHYPNSLLHKAVYPGAPQFLTKSVADVSDNNLFWVIKHGVRFTGMPAWEYNMTDNDIWTVVNFLKNINHLPPDVQQQWQQMPMTLDIPRLATQR